MIPKLFTALLGIVRACAGLFGYEIGVLIDKHEITLEFRDPDEDTTTAWDGSAFVDGCLFVKNWANPATFDHDEEELVTTHHYQTLMRENFVGDILQAEENLLTLKVVLGVLVLMNTLLLGAILLV